MFGRKKKHKRDWKKLAGVENDAREPRRVRAFRIALVLVAVVIGLRLFMLQVLQHGFYEALASGQHEIFEELFPERGDILVRDLYEDKLYSIATNHLTGYVYAEPRKVVDYEQTAKVLAGILGYEMEVCEAKDPESEKSEVESIKSEDLEVAEEPVEEEEQICPTDYEILLTRLNKPDDPYEPIAREVHEDLLEQIEAAQLPGIFFVRELSRTYPENDIGGQLIGFLGADEDGVLSGRYGIEGYFDDVLSGTAGYIQSERDIAGRLIAVGNRTFEPAVDGADVILTIDRTIQFMACAKIREAVEWHGADSGSVVILDPADGAVLAMCSWPDYDPDHYNEVEDINIYNNPAIFAAYEPGSVFKAITMAAAVDSGAVTPASTYIDTGEVKIDVYTIQNSDEQANGEQTMTQVLEKSLNTGVIHAMRETGRDVFRDYIEDFGFGEFTGIQLAGESDGNISSLWEKSEIYSATAAFGQGITVTPLQLAAAFGAIANGGTLYEPYIVKEILYPDGTYELTESEPVRRVITERSAQMLGAMLVSVVEHGHGQQAGVDGYYVAGKTGTAQVPRKDGRGYDSNVTIGSFAGFAPASDAKFAMVVRMDRPRSVQWAESTAAPVFGELTAFLLQYLKVAPERNID
ncbi:penicillin-binding protein 2 [Patescibacteria group bacterium]|nr:penicillin-binding protein 2 [Patescibacteria group bacterium]MBU1906597.1 penicillin-binding protein 2 [Patescibacteria group bacterium]